MANRGKLIDDCGVQLKYIYIYSVYVQVSKHNTDIFAPVMIHILSYDTVKSSDRSVFPKLFCSRTTVACEK